MRPFHVVAALAFLVPGAAVAPASQDMGEFDTLRVELEEREFQYYGSFDGEDVAKFKAIGRALKAISAHNNLKNYGGVIRTAGKVETILATVFPQEFGEAPPNPSELHDGIAEAMNAFRGRIDGELTFLRRLHAGMNDETDRARAQRPIDAASGALESAEGAGTFRKGAREFASAWRTIRRGTSRARRARGGSWGGNTLSASIGEEEFVATSTQPEFRLDTGELIVNASRGYAPSIRITVPGIGGTGTFGFPGQGGGEFRMPFATQGTGPQIVGGGIGGPFTATFVITEGELTVTTYDPPVRIAGTFTFTILDTLRLNTRAVTDGEFDLTRMFVH